ncbi:MAG: 1-acyl-sn-glycerol-3-phosphate acyltransferase [Clostridia bacterium]|nr:1-acyl-sn-glycerol-3-phosphate acyltransferase [Clostridia bacterium]
MTKTYKRYYRWLGWFVRFIFHVKVVGYENIPKKDGFLVCSNHLSGTDPIKICCAMKGHQIFYMAKKELFSQPILGKVITQLGAFPVDRKNVGVESIKRIISILESGDSAGIFPQGTRHAGEDPRTTSVRNGAGMIAVRSKADVLPVFIATKDHKHKLFRKTTIIIGKPMSFKDREASEGTSQLYGEITKEIFDEICKLGEENGYLA